MSNLEEGQNLDEEEQSLKEEVKEIKKYLLSLSGDEMITAHADIECAILGADQRERPDFLRHKSIEAIKRARIEMMQTFRATQR